MPKSSKTKSTKTRVRVKDLPTSQSRMNAKDMKKVKGGGGADVNGDGRLDFSTKKPIGIK